MIKQFCDRCKVETSDAPAGRVSGIADADEHGNGVVTASADLCADCYQGFLDWLAQRSSAELILARVRQALAAPLAADAIDPHAQLSGTPGTRV